MEDAKNELDQESSKSEDTRKKNSKESIGDVGVFPVVYKVIFVLILIGNILHEIEAMNYSSDWYDWTGLYVLINFIFVMVCGLMIALGAVYMSSRKQNENLVKSMSFSIKMYAGLIALNMLFSIYLLAS